jgi:hypothetical protein
MQEEPIKLEGTPKEIFDKLIGLPGGEMVRAELQMILAEGREAVLAKTKKLFEMYASDKMLLMTKERLTRVLGREPSAEELDRGKLEYTQVISLGGLLEMSSFGEYLKEGIQFFASEGDEISGQAIAQACNSLSFRIQAHSIFKKLLHDGVYQPTDEQILALVDESQETRIGVLGVHDENCPHAGPKVDEWPDEIAGG